jgi:hypothetical protein
VCCGAAWPSKPRLICDLHCLDEYLADFMPDGLTGRVA